MAGLPPSIEMPATDITPSPAVSAAIFRGEHVLLVQRRSPPFAGYWSLPGGHIKAGEPAMAAVQRELREEAAIAASVLELADAVDVIERDDHGVLLFHKLILVFYGVWREGEACAGGDASAVRWVQRQELAQLRTTPGLAKAIANGWAKFSPEKGPE